MMSRTAAVTSLVLWIGCLTALGQEITYDESVRERWLEVEQQATRIVRGQLGQELVDEFEGPTFTYFADDEAQGGTFFEEDAVTETVPDQELAFTADASLGGRIQKSAAAPSVGFQRRSPISQSPYIRGYKGGQVYTQANGQHFMSVRTDLDSMLSKIDPALIEDVVVVNGPYGLRYGPAFGYLDVRTYDTPRFETFTVVTTTGISDHTNGGQVFGRETVRGGSCDWGFVISYANRNASDYRPGGNSQFARMPSSYKAQTFLAQYGFDLSENTKLEVRYNRLDQTDTEIAAQFWDIDFLGTDAVVLALTQENPEACSVFTAEGWYNRTRFLGGIPGLNASGGNKRLPFAVLDRTEAAIDRTFGAPPATANDIQTRIEPNSLTRGHLASTGGRLTKSYETSEWLTVNLGADVRYVEQHIVEAFDTSGPLTAGTILDEFTTNMPRARTIDPGLFAESFVQVTPYLRTSVGGRVDFNKTDAIGQGNFPIGQRSPPATNLGNSAGFDQNDTLLAFYIRNDLQLNPNWNINLSGGYAERAPTLIERYADGIFIGVLQSGLNRVIGVPTLEKERLWQVDASVQADYECFRAGAGFYHSWINDYVTYEALNVIDPTGARLLRTFNTDLATLTGFEAYGELDVSERVTLIGTVGYIYGRDEGIDRPLPAITPLDGRVAARLRDACDGTKWGIEFGARMVRSQDNPGFIRLATGTPLLTESRTGGFTTGYVRGYYNFTPYMGLVAGVENVFDRTYREHLDLQLPADAFGLFGVTPVQSPGITPYAGMEWTF